MPSQDGEHLFIEEHFKGRIGRFLDIGAYDGKTFSNTYGLMEAGWEGVCVEPNPLVLAYLAENTMNFPKVYIADLALVPAGFKNENGTAWMWVHQDMLSTLTRAHRDTILRHNPSVSYQHLPVRVRDWEWLLNAYPVDYQFVNIDVEGLNAELLYEMPITPEMVCVEKDPQREITKMRDWLRSHGYANFHEIGGNLLAWR